MNAMLPSFVLTLGWALIHFVWQGTLVGLATAIALMALRNARPQARYAVCCIALALCLALPIIGVWRGLHVDALDSMSPTTHFVQVAARSDQLPAASSATWQSLMQGQLPWIVALWSLGAGLLAVRMALGMMWIGRIGRSRSGATHQRWQTRVDRIAEAFGIQRSVSLRVVDDLCTPVAAGWWRPMVLVPAALIANMPFELLEALLAHELAHIKRHDYLVNLIQSAIEALLFYHPVVWWLSKQIRLEREQIADDLAAQALGEPRRLALALQQLDLFQLNTSQLGHLSSASQLVPAANGGHLMSRIQRLIRPNQHALSWKMALPIIGLTAVCLTVYAHDSAPVPAPVAVATQVAAAAPTVAATAAASAAPAVASVMAKSATSAAAAAPAIASMMATAATSATAPATTTKVTSMRLYAADHEEDGYAIVSAGEQGMTMSGDSRDIPAIDAVKRKVHGDFIWVRRGSKSYVVDDPAIVAKVIAALQPVEVLGKQMQAMGAQMDGPSNRMEDLGKQMESLSGSSNPYNAAMEKTSAQMDALGHQQEAIGSKIEALGNKIEHASDADREVLDRQMQALQDQMKPLEQQMDKLGEAMDEHGKDIEAAQKPIEALGHQMEEESKPMEALGKQMDALGKQEEQLSKVADQKVKVLIDEAMRDGKVQSMDVLR